MSTGFVPEGIKGGLAFETDVTKDPELAAALWSDLLPKLCLFVPKPDYQIDGHRLEDLQAAIEM